MVTQAYPQNYFTGQSLDVSENTILMSMIALGIVACVAIVGMVMVMKK